MSETTGGISALNWPALVAEAIRRRKTEKLTQKEHAALASVSIPTIIAFDRGERTLTLAKASDILRVVGLIEETSEADTRGAFVQAAFERWRALTRELPAASPGRFPAGYYRIDYALEGEFELRQPHRLLELLPQARVPYTGWPMFHSPHRAEFAAREVDGVIECWLPPDDRGELDRPFADAAHCDFWRVAPEGRAFIIRGYQEDGQETFPAGSLFDTTLPIWRLGEALLHAGRLAKLLDADPARTTIRLRALYTGLSARVLKAWASPMTADYLGGGRARSDEAMLEGTAPVGTIDDQLAEAVYPLVSSLYERFGVTGLAKSFVQSELDRMRKNRF